MSTHQPTKFRYRTICCRIWEDDKFQSLSDEKDNAQLLWFFMLTSPFTTCIPGVSKAGEAWMAEVLGWSTERFRERFQQLSIAGLCQADFKNRLIWVPNAIRYNLPANLNVIKSWSTTFNEIPFCPLKIVIWKGLRESIKVERMNLLVAFDAIISDPTNNGMRNRIANGMTNGIPNQDQDHHQEHNQEHKQTATPKSDGELNPNGSGVPMNLTDFSAPPPPLMLFQCRKNEVWPLSHAKFQEYVLAFPTLDVSDEINRACAWCANTPKKRKTPPGMSRFLYSWLNSSLNNQKDRESKSNRTKTMTAAQSTQLEEHIDAGGKF